MESIKLNNKVIGVPADTILNYMKYRKAVKMSESDSTDWAQDTVDMYAGNIQVWIDNEPKLKGLSLEEVIPTLEETTNKLLEDLKM